MVRALAALAVTAALVMVLFSGGEGGARAHQCQGGDPFAFETIEAYDNLGLYLAAIELAAEGKALPSPHHPRGRAPRPRLPRPAHRFAGRPHRQGAGPQPAHPPHPAQVDRVGRVAVPARPPRRPLRRRRPRRAFLRLRLRPRPDHERHGQPHPQPERQAGARRHALPLQRRRGRPHPRRQVELRRPRHRGPGRPRLPRRLVLRRLGLQRLLVHEPPLLRHRPPVRLARLVQQPPQLLPRSLPRGRLALQRPQRPDVDLHRYRRYARLRLRGLHLPRARLRLRAPPPRIRRAPPRR